MRRALSLALAVLILLGNVGAAAEELEIIILEPVDTAEEVPLIELEMAPEPETIELVMIPEGEQDPVDEAPRDENIIEMTPVEMDEVLSVPLIMQEAAPVQLLLDLLTRYGVANSQPIIIDISLIGGTEPVLLTAAVWLDGQAVSVEEIVPGIYSYMPDQGGTYSVVISAQDIAGNTTSAQVDVPVSAGKAEPGAYAAWLGRVPRFSGDQTLAERLVAVASSQLGYRESKDYFIIDDDGVRHGYTVYGDWYGKAYAPWSAIFVSFCLEQAGIPQSVVPRAATSVAMMDRLGDAFIRRGSYKPRAGDLVFFAGAAQGSATHMGIVSRADGASFTAIVGDRGRAVTAQEYALGDPSNIGYMRMNADRMAQEETEELPVLELVATEIEEPILLEMISEEEQPQMELLPDQPILLQANLPGSDCTVLVRYDASSGIPMDAQLTVTEIRGTSYDAYLQSARNALDQQDRENMEAFYLLSISLVSDGVDYAEWGGYTVELVMNRGVAGDAAQALSFAEGWPDRLPTHTAFNPDTTIERITFDPYTKE